MWSGQATTSVSHTAGMGRGSLPKRDIQVERDKRVHHCLSPLGRIVPCARALQHSWRPIVGMRLCGAAPGPLTQSLPVFVFSSLAACLVEAKEWHLTEYSLPLHRVPCISHRQFADHHPSNPTAALTPRISLVSSAPDLTVGAGSVLLPWGVSTLSHVVGLKNLSWLLGGREREGARRSPSRQNGVLTASCCQAKGGHLTHM